MRIVIAFIITIIFIVIMASCDDQRVYQEYNDFDQRYWLVNEQPSFEFTINDTATAYNIYCNIRNSTVYPYSRLFVNYTLQDSSGRELQKKLLNEFLFEAKTGKPFGKSGLGDLYDHQFTMIKNHRFQKAGTYRVKFEQFMRQDTLDGILSVGLRVEKAKVP
jgi:gliding motility-associated lipoprotein GldH